MTTPKNIKQIVEFNQKHKANDNLEKGWIYLGLKVQRSVNAEGSFEDDITYILGEPIKEEGSTE